MRWRTKRLTLDLSRRGEVMAVLNVTPDSFSDGGDFIDPQVAVRRGLQQAAEGAAILDIGGESTRPGAEPVSAPEEINRVLPVIRGLRGQWAGLISIDTSKAEVAAAAIEAGADIVNDVTGLLGDPGMLPLCRDAGCGVVVMHMLGEPRTMQSAPHYGDVVAEVRDFLAGRCGGLLAAGLDPECLCFDPGIGFGKTVEHNLALLRAAGSLAPADRPLLIGLSRKSFIGHLLGDDAVGLREWPTVALTALTREAGVRIHRVHSVRDNLAAMRMAEAVMGAVNAEHRTPNTEH